MPSVQAPAAAEEPTPPPQEELAAEDVGRGLIPGVAPSLDAEPVREDQVPAALLQVVHPSIPTVPAAAEGHSQCQDNPARSGEARDRQRVTGWQQDCELGREGSSKQDSDLLGTQMSTAPISKAWYRLWIAMPRCPVSPFYHTSNQNAQGTDEHCSACQGGEEQAGPLAGRPSVTWLSLKSKAGASDTNCFLYAHSC